MPKLDEKQAELFRGKNWADGRDAAQGRLAACDTGVDRHRRRERDLQHRDRSRERTCTSAATLASL